MDGKNSPPTHRDKAAMNGARTDLLAKHRRVAGSVSGPPAFSQIPAQSFLFQLPNPLLQELPLRFLLGQRQSFLISGPSLGCPAEPAAHIRAG